MIRIKHVNWGLGEDNVGIECSYTQDKVFPSLFKMNEEHFILSIKTNILYEPIKYKEKRYKDVLGMDVTEQIGLYEINEDELL